MSKPLATVVRENCLGAVFDTVDHSILLNRLRRWGGMSGTALKCFYSELLNRSFCVFIKK